MTSLLVIIDYTNHRGERAKREIIPLELKWEVSEWHLEPQWVIRALDLEKAAERHFAMKSIHSWEPKL